MSELIQQFGIDWRLLLAQGVNFLILLFVLKRFAYAPLIALLKKRRHDIEQGIADAKKANEKCAQAEKEREAILQKARVEGLGIVSHAREEGKKKKDVLAKEAEKKVDDLVENARKLISAEKQKMAQEVEKEAEELILRGIAHVLGKMEPEKRDDALMKEALRELKSIS